MNQGISSLQPSHQVAQKSSKTTRPLYAERSTDAPFESLRATSGRGFRDAAGVRSAGALVVRAKDVASKVRSEEHTSELQSRLHLVCRLLLEKKKSNVTTSSRIDLRH